MKDNGLLVQYFNANTPADQTLWAKAAKDAATLKKLGATAVWFPPATKGAAGKDDRGYAPYDLYDLGEFNQKGSVGTRYGTKKEYLEAIDAMKAQGINVYADIAVRQKLGADSVEKVTAADFNAKLEPCRSSPSRAERASIPSSSGTGIILQGLTGSRMILRDVSANCLV